MHGRFYHPEAKLNLPIYLNDSVRDFVEDIALKKKQKESRNDEIIEVPANLISVGEGVNG